MDLFWKDQIQSGGIAAEAEGLIDEIMNIVIKQIGTFYFIKNGIINFLPVFWLFPMCHYAVMAWGKYLGKTDAFSDVGKGEVASSSLAVITLLMTLFFSIKSDRE